MFYKYVLEVSPSVMTQPLMIAYHIDGAALGNLAACYFYAYLLMQIPAGLLIDRMGPRRITTLAILVCSVGSLIFSYASSLWLASLGRFLTGFGAAFAAINCFKLTKNWFSPSRVALMAGLMMSLAMLGAVGGQAPLAALISVVGWRLALKEISLIGFALAIIFWFCIRDRAPHHKNIELVSHRTSLWKQCLHIFKSRPAWLLSLYSGLAFAPVTVFGGLWGVPFISRAYGLSHQLASRFVSLIFIGFAVGAPVCGWLSDAIGSRKKIMGWGTFLAILFSLLILYVSLPAWALPLTFFGFGFTISGFLLCFTMISEISALSVVATAIGFMNAFDALIGALSDPLTGWFLDMGWKGEMVEGARLFPVRAYQYSLVSMPVYLSIALFLLLFIKETYKKKEAVPAAMP